MPQDILDIYTDYLICQNQHATAIGLSNLLEGELSHDQITRFLNRNDYGSKDLWQYVKADVRRHEQTTGGVLIIDDTIEEKPYTDESEIVSWHFSHAKGRCVKGVNILSGLIRYGDIALPISYEIINKDLHFCDIKTKKEKRQSSTTKNQMFRTIVKQAVSNQILFDFVLADNWFGAKDNMEFVHYDIKKFFVFGIKANRLIAFSEEERKKGQYHNLNQLNFKDGEKKIVFLKDLAFPVALVTKIFKNEDGIFASIVSYCKLEFLKIRTTLNHFALKYKLILKANQMAFRELKILREN